MPVFKDEKRGTWYVMAWYRDWTGERKQKCKRGFPTKREAQDWERSFQMQTAADMEDGKILSFDAEMQEKNGAALLTLAVHAEEQIGERIVGR